MCTAYYEKNRYFANRIAQTELARAWGLQNAEDAMSDSHVTALEWKMSGTHQRTDICDLFAKVDKYGLGAGVYPKEHAPNPPAHPFCRCRLVKRYGIDASMASEKEGAERAWLRNLGLNEGARVLGSRERMQSVLDGKDIAAVMNAGKDSMYQVRRVGDVVESIKQSATLETLKTAFWIAKEGGRHSGMLKNYSTLPVAIIERGLSSIRKQIALHESWIADASLKLPSTIQPSEVQHLVEKKWPKDITRLKEEAEVLGGLIEELKKNV